MSNETLHHGATSSDFLRRHRGYVFSLHVCAAGPLSTFPSFIHLKHNTGGVILGEFGFCFYFKLLPAPQRHSKLCKQRHSEQSPLSAAQSFGNSNSLYFFHKTTKKLRARFQTPLSSSKIQAQYVVRTTYASYFYIFIRNPLSLHTGLLYSTGLLFRITCNPYNSIFFPFIPI